MFLMFGIPFPGEMRLKEVREVRKLMAAHFSPIELDSIKAIALTSEVKRRIRELFDGREKTYRLFMSYYSRMPNDSGKNGFLENHGKLRDLFDLKKRVEEAGMI